MQDYYAILGVPKNASKADIDAAYRLKAKELHPDVHPDDPTAADKFKAVNQAYEVLGHPDKRRDYDSPQPRMPQMPQGFGGFGGFHNPFFRQRHPHQQRPRDMQVGVDLGFMEAAKGCKKSIVLHRPVRCNQCNGSGVLSWDTCQACGGKGVIQISQPPFSVQVGCSDCQGQGKTPKQRCGCRNGYSDVVEDSVDIDVPAGIDADMHIRFQGKGENGGDVVAIVRIMPHEIFQRQGATLICEYPVSYSQLVLGDTVDVPGIDNKLSVKIPPGTAPGSRIRLRGQGIEDVTNPGTRGDYYVVLKLEMPKGDAAYETAVRGLVDQERKHIEPLLRKYC